MTWRMLAPCYDYISVTLCLYDHLVFDLLYHFMIESICFVAMHDYGHYALLVGRIQSICSIHASNHQKPSLPKVSTISTYLCYFISTPLWFVHVLPFKPSKILSLVL